MKGKDHLGDVVVDERIIIKYILER